jgi:hypothetical protein
MTAAGGLTLTLACLIEANPSGQRLGNFLGDCEYRIEQMSIKRGN